MAGEEGYAVMSLGPLRSMDGLTFAANVQHCGVGTYGYDNIEVGTARNQSRVHCTCTASTLRVLPAMYARMVCLSTWILPPNKLVINPNS